MGGSKLTARLGRNAAVNEERGDAAALLELIHAVILHYLLDLGIHNNRIGMVFHQYASSYVVSFGF